jgi:hypothetical protein
MVGIVPILYRIFLTLLLCLCTSHLLAAVNVFVDRNEINLNESFNIRFEIDASVNVNPDFSPLERNFEILSRSQSTSVNMINNSYRASTHWTLDVMAKKAGSLEIPPIEFGNDFSQKKTISIKDAAPGQSGGTAEEIFFEVDAQPRNPYVQAQVIYTIRLYRAFNTHDSSLTEPQLSGAKAIVEKLGDDISFDTRRKGRRYLVVERRYAIFPQSSGDITIEPVVFTGQVSSGRRSLFDFGLKPRLIRTRSEKIELIARPIAEAFQGKSWLPTKQMQLSETWSQDPPEFREGEPITRTLAVIAEGLTSGQLPVLQAPIPESFRQYPDKAELNDKYNPEGVIGMRQEKIALIPTNPGDFVLPEIEIPWWNTETERMEVARLPSRTVSVQTASAAAQSPPNAQSLAQKGVPEQKDLLTAPVSPLDTPSIDDQSTPFIWIIVCVILALGWMITALLWWRSVRIPRSRLSPDSPNPNARKAIKWLKQACESGNPVEAKNALLTWSAVQWLDNPATSLGLLADRCSGPLKEEILKLNHTLYSPSAVPWRGGTLYKAINQFSAMQTQQNKDHAQALEPLFRI